MNKTFLFLFLIASIVLLCSCESKDETKTNPELQISISNITEIKGSMYIAIYNNETDFMKKTFKELVLPITQEQLNTNISVSTGKYAISVFQDLNNNKILDKNEMGIPTEPYGISKHPNGIFALPTFEECATVINEKTLCEIKMNRVTL